MKSWHIALLATLALTALYMLSVPSQGSTEFDAWKIDFGKTFTAEEQTFRKVIFSQTLAQIKKHNADSKQTYEKGVNQFTHLTPQEFEQLFLSTIYTIKSNHIEVPKTEMTTPLTEIDWQALGKVTSVKDQGQCDAGYAFCSAGLAESYYLFDNKNISLSEQQIIDCSEKYTTFGCQGGSRIGTINYILENGLTTASSYPYKGTKGNCQKPEGGENKPKYTHQEYNGCDAINKGLYTSPLTVAVNAKTWATYKSGIYDGCTSTEVNHDTYLIGATAGFWRIKNSWGIRWGEYGYIRLKIGNTCGICEKPGFGFKK